MRVKNEQHRIILLREETLSSTATRARASSDRSRLSRELLLAGIWLRSDLYLVLTFALSLTIGFMAYRAAGELLAISTFSFSSVYLLRWHLSDRARRRHLEVVPQIAPFVDAVIDGIGLGITLESAIIQAARGVPRGTLRAGLRDVVEALERGHSLRKALYVLRDHISGREIVSVVVAMTLLSSRGGGLIEPLNKLSSNLRRQQLTLESVNRDLKFARFALYLITIIALAVPAMIFILSPEYVNYGLSHPGGELVLQLCVVLFMVTLVCFKVITNIEVL